MPANLTPVYRAAEARYRDAKAPGEKIAALEEMLSVMPKHKGTEHLQGDIKARLSKLRREGGKKSGARRIDPYKVDREGAAQVILVGTPNAGKSELMRVVTHAEPDVASYPYTTQRQMPGMMPYEDIQIQLVDTPALSLDYSQYWIFELIKYADAVLLVVDLGVPDPLEQVEEIRLLCQENRITLCSREPETYDPNIPFSRRCIIAGNKIDLLRAEQNREIFRESLEADFPLVFVSAKHGQGFEELKKALFEFLELVRVYTKSPHQKFERNDPDVFRKGSTVIEVAESIHQDFAERFKFARVWGEGKFDGQRVPRDYKVEDGDVIEIHT